MQNTNTATTPLALLKYKPIDNSFLLILPMAAIFPAGKWIARFRDLEATATNSKTKCFISASIASNSQQKHYQLCSLSMNGCQGDPKLPIGIIETRTLVPVPTPELAMDCLSSAIYDLKCHPPSTSSGIIRIQVPIEKQIEAIDWLHAQSHHQEIPRFFYSGRRESNASHFFIDYTKSFGNGNGSSLSPPPSSHDLISVAGLGAAVYFRHFQPFSFDNWRSIRRFLSESCPLIRAYGAIRFDAKAEISAEWEPFGSFYFMVPQVEFDELEGKSLLAANVAWDDSLSCSWEMAIESFQAKLDQVTYVIKKFEKVAHKTSITGNILHVPSETDWYSAVKNVVHMIRRSNSTLTKVVLARSSRIFTASDIDPVAWLACLQVEGDNAYQFLLQPPNAPAFVGNTPEQLFYRKNLSIWSEALAGTRARYGSRTLDHTTGLDLLSSPKDDLEFTIVRECIRKKLEAVCNSVLVDPKKAIRKLPRVQHLYAQLKGRLRNEDDEFDILSSLHPSPAVCGFPTEEARCLITETEMFDRGMYAGPVGWFGGKEAEFAVGIRSALVKQGFGALIFAGTGIVEGSNPSSEWEELELKIMQFTKLLRLEVPLLDSVI